MKILGIVFTSLFLVACNENVKPVEAGQAEVELEYPLHFDGAWVMSAHRRGYMGVALAVSEDKYYYWMYSDVGGDAGFPYTGTFRTEGDNLVLGSPTVLATGESTVEMPGWGLYSKNWRILREGFSLRIHATSDTPEDHKRTLYPDFGFDPRNPFKNQGYMGRPDKS